MVVAILVVACGVGCGIGIAALVTSLRNRTATSPSRLVPRSRLSTKPSRYQLSWSVEVGLALGCGLIAGLLTKWPVAVLLAAGGGLCFPLFLRATSSSPRMARTEAIATWTEFLRDTLAGASGLSQAIIATASVSPGSIRTEVGVLASRLSNGFQMSEALRMFADEVGDPSADLVVCALILAAEARATRLVELLGALADSMREEVAMRLRVESNRASARSGVRTIVVFSVSFAVFLAVIARSYLVPFGSSQGQFALLAAGAFDAAGILLMIRLVREPPSRRLLGHAEILETRT